MKAKIIAWNMGGRIAAPSHVMAVATLACAAFTTPASAHDTVFPAQQFQLALEAQTIGHYGEMLVLLRSAGEAGHLPAQEMLGMALLTGPTMYGHAVPADRCEAGRWIRRALAQGSEVARYQSIFLRRLRHAPVGVAPCDLSSG
ncbi:MAG: sel1 repeat family protein [Pseudomonadota bacterium]